MVKKLEENEDPLMAHKKKMEAYFDISNQQLRGILKTLLTYSNNSNIGEIRDAEAHAS